MSPICPCVCTLYRHNGAGSLPDDTAGKVRDALRQEGRVRELISLGYSDAEARRMSSQQQTQQGPGSVRETTGERIQRRIATVDSEIQSRGSSRKGNALPW
ncbi:hypothetical protein KIPB_000563 [Kipferlia bialata]|uniref:Uncharacterized protein n=1 Tax=Kipferlia bialata TaxID=797122 RepID=A0A9K3GES2_9EUKA|nr:hypothetical protein KIPB_000563 [Kipferlia bialata]|eukprot:g563.t1